MATVKPPLAVKVGDTAQLRKPHACGGNEWLVIAVGMDIRVRCNKCGRSVLLPRSEFEKSVKRLTPAGKEEL